MENRNRRWVRLGTHRKTKQNRMEEINVNKEERVEGEKNVSQLGRRRTCRNNNFPCAAELWSAGEKVDCSRLAFFKRKKHVRHAWRDRFFISLFKNCNLYLFSSFIVSLRVLVCDRRFTDSATIIFVDSTVKNCKGEEGGDDVSKQKKRSLPSCPHFQVERDLCCIARYPLCLGNVLLRSRTILQNDLRNRRDNRQ